MICKLDDGRLYAEILTDRGANPIRLIDRQENADILRSPKALSDFETDNPYLYGMPLLFLPNRISGGRFSFDGREYILPINEPQTGCYLHGTLHKTPFSVTELTKTKVCCVYKATKNEPYLTFPHEFELSLTYELSDGAFVQTAEFKNNSDCEMPVALAFHTTFNIPFVNGSTGEDVTAKIEVDREFLRDKNYLPTGEILESSRYISELSSGMFCPPQNTVSAFFEDSGKGKAILTDRRTGTRLVYEADEGYGYWMIYNGGAKDFFCVEPQTWATNCPNLAGDPVKNGFQTVAPHKTKRYVTRIYCERA